MLHFASRNFLWSLQRGSEGMVNNLRLLAMCCSRSWQEGWKGSLSSYEIYQSVLNWGAFTWKIRTISKPSVYLWTSSVGIETAFFSQCPNSPTATDRQRVGKADPRLIKHFSSPPKIPNYTAAHHSFLLHSSSTRHHAILETSQYPAFQMLDALIVWFQRCPTWLYRS